MLRYFYNNLPDYVGGQVHVPRSALKALQAALDYALAGRAKPFAYTGEGAAC